MKPDCSGDDECRSFYDSVYHYLANELHEGDRSRLQQHLDACPGCARYLEFEEGFSSALRARLPRLGAPEGLLDRVTSVLDRESVGARRRVRLRTYVGAAGFTAAGAFLVALGLPTQWWGGRAVSVPVHVTREVTVVDEACDRAGLDLERQRDCQDEHHWNALKLEDGSYWNLSVDGPEARRIVADSPERGRRLLVEGELDAPIRTLRVTHVRELTRGDP